MRCPLEARPRASSSMIVPPPPRTITPASVSAVEGPPPRFKALPRGIRSSGVSLAPRFGSRDAALPPGRKVRPAAHPLPLPRLSEDFTEL